MVVAFVALFHPDDTVSALTAAFVLVAIVFGVIRHRRIGPKELQAQPAG